MHDNFGTFVSYKDAIRIKIFNLSYFVFGTYYPMFLPPKITC
jgi:hypothetical protein